MIVLGVLTALLCIGLMAYGAIMSVVSPLAGLITLATGAFGLYQVLWTWLHNRNLRRDMERHR